LSIELNKEVLILDGGMGRELQRQGAPFRQPEWSALAMIEAPEMVESVHQAFIENGSQVITTNSYALVPFHIGEKRFQEQGLSLAESAGKVARQAVEKSAAQVQVAGSIPPLFGSYRPDLFDPARVTELATPLIQGLAPHVDFWLAETQSLIAETCAIKALLDKLLPEHKKPLLVSFTLDDTEPTSTPRLRSGELVRDAISAMANLNVDAILFNCCQPEFIQQALQIATTTLQKSGTEQIRLGAYANAFPPQPKDATANDGLDELRKDLDPQAYLQWAKQWQQSGASLIGGCCGIGPEHIHELKTYFTHGVKQ
jgi:S-methylmethionine-dependent homocysteine/selenocysteine methylase